MTQVNLKVKYPVSPWQVYSVTNVSVVVTLLALKVQHTQVLFAECLSQYANMHTIICCVKDWCPERFEQILLIWSQ